MYAGRVTADKGVLGLVDAAAMVAERTQRQVVFEICGDGPALDAVEARIQAGGLEEMVKVHGRLNRQQMREAFSRCHLVAVATTSAFSEGFCMVAAEAVLAGRPLVVSDVVPAVEVLKDAALVVPANNWAALADAIVRLANDESEYCSRQLATGQYQEQFYDRSQGWGAMVETAILDSTGRRRDTAIVREPEPVL